MNIDIKLHKNDLPDDLDLGNVIAIDGEFMGLNVRRDPLCLIQISSGKSDAHIIQLDRSNYQAPNLIKILKDQNSDTELLKMAEFELKELQTQHEKNEKKLKLFLLPKDEADKKNAIIEIRAGTGGLEASLFASDLFKMYEKVSNKKRWSLEIISISRSEAGGLKKVIASIKGDNIYSTLKYESGVHRVQRVPDTETQGRVHTSAATVAVLPEAEEVDVKINDSDLIIDVFRAG